MIDVYTKPNCIQCTYTKRALDKAQLAYRELDITTPEHYAYVTETLGYAAAPVVVDDDFHWSGYRPDIIDGIALYHQREADIEKIAAQLPAAAHHSG